MEQEENILGKEKIGKYGISRGEIERMCPAFQGDV